jgi:hypothetical protein
MTKECKVCGSVYESEAAIRNRKGSCQACVLKRQREKYVVVIENEGGVVDRFNKLLSIGKKECNKCLQIKELDLFSKAKVKHGRRSSCKECDATLNKKYEHDNKATINANRRNRRKDPIRSIILTQRDRQRSLFKTKFKNKKKATTSVIREWLGCSVEECKIFLEKKFTDSMTWGNRGVGKQFWQIDHIIPVSLTEISPDGDIVDSVFNRKIWHYTNLQPLWHVDNAKKSNKYEFTETVPMARVGAGA